MTGHARLAAIAAVLLLATGHAVAQQRFSNPTAGISLVPPAGWTVVSMQQVMENRSRVRVPDDRLQAGLQSATAPLFVFAKHPEPHASLNPTVQIVLRPRPASLPPSPTALLRIATETLQRAFPDFRFVEPIRTAEVSGMPAAYMKAAYTLKTAGGQSHRVLARTWLVPRGTFMFLIGMSGAAEGADVAETEFADTVKTVTIEK